MMNLIPVTLEFSQVAPNFRAQLVLETPGATWSIGRNNNQRGLGFSCNAGMFNGAQSTSVQSVELTKSMLSIFTGASTSSATLTAVLSVPHGLQSIEGYCTLNDQAVIYARFGCGPLMEWRQGRICGNVPHEDPNLRFVSLAIAGLTTGQSIIIELAGSNAEAVRWATAPGVGGVSPFTITTPNQGVIPVGSLSFTPHTITLFTCGGGGSNEVGELFIETYIECSSIADSGAHAESGKVKLSAICDAGVIVIAQIPGQYPEYLTSTPKIFSLL